MNSIDGFELAKSYGEPMLYTLKAEDELIKRLNLRFPSRNITKADVYFTGTASSFGFDGSPLHCKVAYFMQFCYNNKRYEIETKDGLNFDSICLKLDLQYERNKLDIAIQNLSKNLGKTVEAQDIVVDSYEKKHEDETYYVFGLIFNGKKHTLCFDEYGLPEKRQRAHSS